VIDLSTLRLHALADDLAIVEQFLVKWKSDILTEACRAEMQPIGCLEDDEDGTVDKCTTEYAVSLDENSSYEAWASYPIWKLPVVSLGVFEGSRSNAKAMARSLALLWDIPEQARAEESNLPSRRDANVRIKAVGQKDHRKRKDG
jgi:hypothetical protein